MVIYDFINHNFTFEFVDTGLYFVQDKTKYMYPLLQVGSGSGEKSHGSGWPKINGSDRILIPDPTSPMLYSNKRRMELKF